MFSDYKRDDSASRFLLSLVAAGIQIERLFPRSILLTEIYTYGYLWSAIVANVFTLNYLISSVLSKKFDD